MIDFTALMASITADGETSSVTATEDWLQGRTIYGGLSAAFCLESVAQHVGDLPPLRSAKPASIAALVALTDAPPPAALVLFERPGPISTMTWAIDLLTDRIETIDGWWLLQTKAENIVGGYSSQATTLWNADRQPVLVSRQNVAVFM
jgi:acyl-CoA thioesterase